MEKILSRNALKIMLSILVIVLLILLILYLVSLVTTSVDFIKNGYSFSLSAIGIKTYLCAIKPYNMIFTSILTLIAVVLTIITISLNTEAKETSSLFDLRNALNQPDNVEIHDNLRGKSGKWKTGENPTTNEEWRKVDNYLGTLELGAILIKKGVITFENFDHQFGYRVYNVVTQKEIVNKIMKENELWSDLIYLINLKSEWKQEYNKNL